MARSIFLRNLRTAAGFLSPTVRSDFYGDQHKLARVLKSAAIWLTPGAVEEYDEIDFPELPADERKTLTNGIRAFQQVAQDVPSNQPASEDQLRRALPAFLAILDVLKDYLDHDAVRAHQLFDDQTWPDYVVGFSSQAGEDSTGDPCLWVTIFLTNDIVDRPDFGRLTWELRRKFVDVLEKAGIERRPYVRFWSVSERDILYANPV